jgi:predicted Fe-Mo cluster-binding NifX family protein
MPAIGARGNMKIAFATTDGVHVNAELRSAPRLDVYEVSSETVRLQRSTSLAELPNGISSRIRALAGVGIVYVSAVGPSTAARLAAHGVRVATSLTRSRIDEHVAAHQATLRAAGCAAS